MAVGRLNEYSLRPGEHLLAWAFALSLAAHLLGYGSFELGHRLGWWKKDLMPAWLKTTKERLAEMKRVQPQPQQPPPLIFVETDPTAAPVEAPKDAKYYSAHNSRAANVHSTADTPIPRIDGSQKHVPQALNPTPPKAVPLQPTPPKPQPQPAEAKPKQPVGDLALAQPQADAAQPAQPPEHVRPRRLEDVVRPQVATDAKIKQDGGLAAHMNSDSFDAKATPFGEYDWRLVQTIKARWLDLLQTKSFSRDRSGRVVVEFRLLASGRITDMKVASTEVDELLTYVCQSAISDPAPYEPWPSDMRRFFGQDYRDVQFTFWYE